MNKIIQKLYKQSLEEKPVMLNDGYGNFTIPKLHEGKQVYTERVNITKYTELLITECVRILITNEGNEKTVDAIWDLQELGVDINKICDIIDKE